jgi:PKD repeat protein
VKLNTFAVLSFLTCFLLAVSPIVSAFDNTEVYVVSLDESGNSYYMESLGNRQGPFFSPKELSGYLPDHIYSYGIGMGDFDNDGDLDYVMGDGYPSGSIYLFEKLGPGNDFSSPLKVGTWSEGILPMDIAVADFNEDGNLDFILTQYGNIYCELHTGNGQLEFKAEVIADATPKYPVGADVADFNNDGHADFVVVPFLSYESPTSFFVNLGRGDGTFTTIEIPTYKESTYYGVAAGDFDGDGIVDLVATRSYFYDIYLGVGDGTFDWGGTRNYDAYGWAPVDNYDFNGDQIQDLVIGGYENQYGIGVFIGDGEGGFTHKETYLGDGYGKLTAISAPPYVQNISPVAVIDPDYQEITVGQAVSFDGEGSYDEDGEIIGYAWDFGEQSLLKTLRSTEESSTQHVFYETGIYTITLTVTDDKGARNSVTAQVRVKPLTVKVRLTPKTLNPKSKGKWVKATIWLPKGFDASQIDLNSVCLFENQEPLVYAHSDRKWDRYTKRLKKKGIRKLKVKFDRQALLASLSNPAGVKTLYVQGKLHLEGTLSQRKAGSISFEGADTIRTMPPRIKYKPDPKNGNGDKERSAAKNDKFAKFMRKLATWFSFYN